MSSKLLLAPDRHAQSPTDFGNDRPPSTLSPLLVGLLVSKKVYPTHIVALLVDLCQRGYLVIVKKNNEYYLSQRRVVDEHLQSWEREIVDQLFPSLGKTVSVAAAKQIGSQALFAAPVRQAVNQIYRVGTSLDFFVENPRLTRIRFKLFAVGCCLAALVGGVWIVITNASPYLLIPLLGSLLVAQATFRWSAQLARYTATGLKAQRAWLAFGNYLGSNRPLAPSAAHGHLFERYLAYAICLDQTERWANRFESSLRSVKLGWFVSYEDLSPAKLANELVSLTEIIARELVTL